MTYIYQNKKWPILTWDEDLIYKRLDKLRYQQGELLGMTSSLGFEGAQNSLFKSLTFDVMNTSAIEGEILDLEEVRSSIARKLGIEYAGLVPSSRSVDGIVGVLLDATLNYNLPLSHERLFEWNKALFPSGYSGFTKIPVGRYRDDKTGSMQVISGPIGREKIHYQAIEAPFLYDEMEQFIEWFNTSPLQNVLKASIAHFWFVTIHPFDDGNGRIARALADMLLARSEQKAQRFYSMSSEIKERKSEYYKILEKTQKGTLDVTNWMLWFLECFNGALSKSKILLQDSLKKADFWQSIRSLSLNQRQIKMINMLFDGFEGHLTTSKWAKINNCSQDTAYRDILELVEHAILEKSKNAGRSTHYVWRESE